MVARGLSICVATVGLMNVFHVRKMPVVICGMLWASGCATPEPQTSIDSSSEPPFGMYTEFEFELTKSNPNFRTLTDVNVTLVDFDPQKQLARVRISSMPGLLSATVGECFDSDGTLMLKNLSDNGVTLVHKWFEPDFLTPEVPTFTLMQTELQLSDSRRAIALSTDVTITLVDFDPAMKVARIRLSTDSDVLSAKEGEYFGSDESLRLEHVSGDAVTILATWCESNF